MDISGSWICFHSVFGFRQNCRSYLIYRLEIWQKLLLIKARSIAALTKQYTLRTLQHFKESHLLWISVLERQEGDHCVFMFSSLSSNNAHWAVCVLLHISPRFDLCCSYSRTTLSRSVTFFSGTFLHTIWVVPDRFSKHSHVVLYLGQQSCPKHAWLD